MAQVNEYISELGTTINFTEQEAETYSKFRKLKLVKENVSQLPVNPKTKKKISRLSDQDEEQEKGNEIIEELAVEAEHQEKQV